MRRFSISVDDRTYAAIMAVSEKDGRSMASVVGDLLRGGIDPLLDKANITKKRVDEVLSTLKENAPKAA